MRRVDDMKSITIHGLDNLMDRLIREKAEKEKLSLNKTMKKLLRKALGLNEQGENHRSDFVEFLGQWSEQDILEFKKGTKDFGEVNNEDWQ